MSNVIPVLPLIFISAAWADTTFLGPIPVQYVAPGAEIVLDMHRFYEPGKTELEFTATKEIDIVFDKKAFQLRARVKKPGLADVRLKAGDAKSRILTLAVMSDEKARHRFAFKPVASAAKIVVAGTFNGWSQDKTPLTGPNSDGEYTTEVPLPAGKHSYKFVVDGKWMLDPANPEKEDNGMGDKNSVLIIGSGKKKEPTIFAEKLTPGRLELRIVSEEPVTTASALLETAAESIALPAKTSGATIAVEIPAKQTGYVRVVAATSTGAASNVVRCAIGPAPFRWQDAVLYYAFTDRFANGDRANDKPVDNPNVQPPANFHGGDLQGIRSKIEDGYFESLGVNAIWIAPLNKNPAGAYQEYPEPRRWYTGYHGYWPVSATEIDPHTGSGDDLRQLVATAHARGIKVIADLVLHHVHEEHPWWKQHRDWFGTLDLPGGRKNLRLWDEHQFTTWFEPYLPSFDFAKEEPTRALIANTIWWAKEYKLDGFRLDAVKHILPQFWPKFRRALREEVDREREVPLYLVGETFKDRAGIMSFVGPNMLDGQFDFPLYDTIKDSFARSTGEMRAVEDSLRASEQSYGKETLMSPLIGNHDKGRFMAFADGDLPDPAIEKEEEVGWKKPPTVNEASSFAKLVLAQAFLMSIDGVPMIYYGDEIGMTGAGDPDNRRDMRFGDQVSAEEKRVLEKFRKLGALRRAHPALRYGSRRVLAVERDFYAFARAHLEDRVIALFNRGQKEVSVDLAVSPELVDGNYVDSLSGAPVSVKDGKLVFKLGPQTAAFVTK